MYLHYVIVRLVKHGGVIEGESETTLHIKSKITILQVLVNYTFYAGNELQVSVNMVPADAP